MAYTAIDDSSAHFQIDLYSGDGASSLALTFDGNSNVQPDLVWIKNRDTTDVHILADSTRGVGKYMSSDSTLVNTSDADTVEAFGSDGFTVGDDVKVNTSGEDYVAYGWKAGGASRTTNSESGDNPAGGYQANTTAGFSVVDYVGTGAVGTMAHGIGVAPTFMMIKSLDDAYSWYVHHSGGTAMDAGDSLFLESNAALVDSTQYWNDTVPTSTVFTLGDGSGVNKNDSNFIAYVFAPIQGYSKFGGFTACANTDGPFIYTGFKPKWLIIKKHNSATDSNWIIMDNKRSTFNDSVGTEWNQADVPNAEGNRVSGSWHAGGISFLSNGFKIYNVNGELNGTDGDTLVYAAFAEHPFVSSEGTPCTAR